MSRTNDTANSIGYLVDAALTLRGELFAMDVIRSAEPIVVELTPDAGRRFSVAVMMLPVSDHPVPQAERIRLLEGFPARREAVLGGVTFRWEVYMIADAANRAVPEPLPVAVANLPPQALSRLGHG